MSQLGPGSPCQGIPGVKPDSLALSNPTKLLSAPELGPSTQQLQKEEWDPQDNLVWIPKSSALQQPPGPSLPGL